MASSADLERRAKPPVALWRWVLAAAAVCFCSTCWSFTREVSGDRLVDVTPAHTVLPLLLFAVIAFAGRRSPVLASRVIAVVAGVVVVLTAGVLPIAINLAIDADRMTGGWPLNWIVPVHVLFRRS